MPLAIGDLSAVLASFNVGFFMSFGIRATCSNYLSLFFVHKKTSLYRYTVSIVGLVTRKKNLALIVVLANF